VKGIKKSMTQCPLAFFSAETSGVVEEEEGTKKKG